VSRHVGHQVDAKGKVTVVKSRQPRQMRGMGAYTEATVRIGPLSRLLGAAADRIGR